MPLRTVVLSMALTFSIAATANAQKVAHPGLQPFIPTRIDWLVTDLQASLRYESIGQDGFLLQITAEDSETISIYVRYLPTVNREAMNTTIEAAKHVINVNAKSRGWLGWLKVREDVQMVKRPGH
jgi:hypothetical protein